MKTEADRTPIQNFYARQTIVITGGTGFLGKMLTEKLLRSCPDISTIYLMIRSQKDKCPKNRLDEMLENPLYDHVKKEVPNFRKKIVPIRGDFNVKGGLSESDKNMLISKVSIIFHIAANVKFYEKIKIATIVNIDATATILKLAKHMPNLKSFIHVSTIYSNCHVKHIEERLYSYPINYKYLIMFARNLPENIFEEKISKIVSHWPNTYTFTKAIAEGLFKNESGDLPIGIFQPAIIISSASEPLVGWIDNMYGPSDFTRSLLLGVARFVHCGNHKANIVPVDFTANALIASAWDVHNQHGRVKDMLIYNFVAPIDGPTWKEYIYVLLDINKMYPLHNAIYLPLVTFFKHEISYRFCICFGHFLPALLLDAASICIGCSPRMWKLYMKVDKFNKTIEPFCNTEWSYSTDNIQSMWDNLNEKDQQLFNFNMMKFNWTEYLINYYQGMRFYQLNENDSMLKDSRTKYARFYWIHQIIKTILFFIIFWIIWFIFRGMF